MRCNIKERIKHTQPKTTHQKNPFKPITNGGPFPDHLFSMQGTDQYNNQAPTQENQHHG
jgi:hypothetical protein